MKQNLSNLKDFHHKKLQKSIMYDFTPFQLSNFITIHSITPMFDLIEEMSF